jgi:hypothetical protein
MKALDSKQDQAAAFQIVSNTYKKHNPTCVLQYVWDTFGLVLLQN